MVALCCGGSEEDGYKLVIFVLVDLQFQEVAVSIRCIRRFVSYVYMSNI